MKPALIYCYDAYCGWCYAFSPVMKQVADHYKDSLPQEVLSGGMILPDSPRPFRVLAPYIANSYKLVEELSGIRFGEDYLWHVFHPDQSDWYPNSEKPAIALCVFKDYHPNRQIEFSADLQYAHHFEGRDLTDDEAYRHLLLKYKIPVDDFYSRLSSAEYKEKAHAEFYLVQQLRVTGFPAVFIQAAETKFFCGVEWIYRF